MPKPDAAHLQTDKELAKLEKRIAKIYKEAADDLQKTIDDYFAKFAKRDAKQKARLEAGEITEQEYKQWRLAQMGSGERFKELQSRVAERYTEANETAVRYVNDATPGIYSLNRNYSAYTIEKVAGNIGFDLWDEQTVKRLIVENPEVMPYYPPEKALKRGIDLAYGKKQISASVTSSILQGKSIPGIAKDLQTRIPEMNNASAIRTARTAVTGAQNAGRMDSYVAAEKMGIKVRKEWLSTIDGRTRHSHAMLDGKVVDKDKKFENGCMFPGDPNGPPWEVYNCRCTLIAAVDGVDTSNAQRRVRNPETGKNELVSDMTYSEWAGLKEKAQVQKAMAEKQESFAEKLANQKLSPHSWEYDTFEEFWEARKSFISSNGKESDFLDDVFAGKIDIVTGWVGGDGKHKIAQLENTIAELQKIYPLNPSKNLKYGTTIQKLRVCDYENAYMYLPDGKNDRRLVGSAIGQVFENGSNNAVIAFDRNWMYQTLEQTIEERSKKISLGKVLDSVNGSSPQTVAMHEWGHLMSNHIENAMINGESTAEEYWEWYKTLSKDEIRNGLSDYATTNRGEFEAECFAELMMPNPRPLALKYKEFLDKCIELGY